MTVNGDISVFDLRSIRHNLNPAPVSYITFLISKEFLSGNFFVKIFCALAKQKYPPLL
jgi:hypothetical protein